MLDVLTPVLHTAFIGPKGNVQDSVASFTEFWQATYAEMDEPEDDWPEEIKVSRDDESELKSSEVENSSVWANVLDKLSPRLNYCNQCLKRTARNSSEKENHSSLRAIPLLWIVSWPVPQHPHLSPQARHALSPIPRILNIRARDNDDLWEDTPRCLIPSKNRLSRTPYLCLH